MPESSLSGRDLLLVLFSAIQVVNIFYLSEGTV